ncbi:hypothetical protein [Pseudomonas aeruginosa]|uniref:hypothetical protein n=1 Tax=Pseudomonas aeruginosa TaxID=287 RepID=UPI00128D4417|nr:hypothetical protein [Pseudomonas aeruginosa]
MKEVEAKPLGLDDWLNFKGGDGLPVKIRGQVAQGTDQRNPTYPPIGNTAEIELTIDPVMENECICLVAGGWVPLLYQLGSANIFVDRNIVSEINTRFVGGELKAAKGVKRDFLEFLSDANCTSTLNTLPYALEGNQAKIPNLDVVSAQFDYAIQTINRALPKSKVWPSSNFDRNQAQLLIDAYREYFERGMSFLKNVAPLLESTPSKARRVSVWGSLFAFADAVGISRQHICVLASLSVVSADQGFNPAKKIIKPKKHYEDRDAYNAMYDLFLLFLLNTFHFEHPESKSALLTRDKNLAMFWMGMTMRETQDGIGGKSKEVLFHPKLLSLDSEEIRFLQSQLGKENLRAEFHV